MRCEKEIVIKKKHVKSVKCVVWDLDNTLWEGVLLEDCDVRLRDGVSEIIKTLDSRGILQSIASKNDHLKALSKLKEFNLHEYFLHPQVNWNSKAASIKAIADLIGIGLDTVAFIDDLPSEREEVSFSYPEVLCLDAADLGGLLSRAEMIPRFVTEDSRVRRLMYLCDLERKRVEEEYIGTKEEFLATLDIVLTVSLAQEDDLRRAEELTIRTNQLNTTGITYSYDELNRFRQSKQHKLLMASLEDKYGSYGKVGLALVECREGVWTIELLLMSCRVMNRGVGTVLINHLMSLAKKENARLRAKFIANERNRMMYVTYKFSGFKEIQKIGNFIVLENELGRIQPLPQFLKVLITS